MASLAWERRNALARARGYRNYYDYRVHDYGRQSASEPPARGQKLRRLRGHGSAGVKEGNRLRRDAGEGDFILAFPHRDKQTGDLDRIYIVRIPEDGPEEDYMLPGPNDPGFADYEDWEMWLDVLVSDLDDEGVDFSLDYPLDTVTG